MSCNYTAKNPPPLLLWSTLLFNVIPALLAGIFSAAYGDNDCIITRYPAYLAVYCFHFTVQLVAGVYMHFRVRFRSDGTHACERAGRLIIKDKIMWAYSVLVLFQLIWNLIMSSEMQGDVQCDEAEPPLYGFAKACVVLLWISMCVMVGMFWLNVMVESCGDSGVGYKEDYVEEGGKTADDADADAEAAAAASRARRKQKKHRTEGEDEDDWESHVAREQRGVDVQKKRASAGGSSRAAYEKKLNKKEAAVRQKVAADEEDWQEYATKAEQDIPDDAAEAGTAATGGATTKKKGGVAAAAATADADEEWETLYAAAQE